jgi:peptide deformylase
MLVRKSQLQLVSPDNSILYNTPPKYNFDLHKDTTELFANLMFSRMQELGGMGLAANQVGVNIQFFTMGLDVLRMDVFNPEIISTDGEIITEEGCLTYPGIFLQIKRPLTIEVKFYTAKEELIKTKLTGLTARIFLHEYDHLNGITFKEKVSVLKWSLANKKLNNYKSKLKKEIRQRYIVDTYKEMQNASINTRGV